MNHAINRPTPITVTCVTIFVVFIFGATSMAWFYGPLTSLYGEWYGPFWIASLLLSLVSLIGFWQMKRWGVYTYIGMFVGGTAVGLVMGIPFTIIGLIVPLAISILGIANLKKMT